MSDPTPTTPDPLAVALAKLEPAAHGFNSDAFMFAAGRESKAWVIACWKTAAVCAALTAAAFAYLYFTHLR